MALLVTDVKVIKSHPFFLTPWDIMVPYKGCNRLRSVIGVFLGSIYMPKHVIEVSRIFMT